MMEGQEPCLFYIQLGPLTRPSPTRQARTMPRPCLSGGALAILSLDMSQAGD
jgi:hypothetical protein